jgi:hypothetical protein
LLTAQRLPAREKCSEGIVGIPYRDREANIGRRNDFAGAIAAALSLVSGFISMWLIDFTESIDISNLFLPSVRITGEDDRGSHYWLGGRFER